MRAQRGRSSRRRRSARRRARSASARACSRPVSFSGVSEWPWTRPLGVPVGLAVPREEDRGHAGYASGRWISASATAPASSPARPGGSGCETVRLLLEEGARVVTCGRRRGARGRGDAARRGPISAPPASRSGSSRRLPTRSAGSTCLVNNVGIARPGEVRGRAGRGVGRLLAAERDEPRARDPRRATASARVRPGAIVNVSSTAAKRPSTGMPHYSVTKAAVLSLSRLVADLYAKDGIRCNAVTPGPTATRGLAGRRRARRPAGRRPRRGAREGRRGAPARPARRARGDRGGGRLPLLRSRVVRDRRRLERRRRHGADHHLSLARTARDGSDIGANTVTDTRTRSRR